MASQSLTRVVLVVFFAAPFGMLGKLDYLRTLNPGKISKVTYIRHSEFLMMAYDQCNTG